MNKRKYLNNQNIHNLVLRIILFLFSVILLFWGLLPYIRNRINNEGVKATTLVTLSIIIICVFWNKIKPVLHKIWNHKVGRFVLAVILIIISFFLILFIVVSSVMLYAAAQKPSKQSTVIVLGAAVRDDGPSAMLADRLDSAIRYLNENDDSVCIVSGGKGPDEPAAEADIMYEYLVNRGIDSERIYKEDQSKNTQENIRFSKEIIEQKKLNLQIVIATQEFHQFRAQSLAKSEGFTNVSPCTCRTKLYLLECYWVREFAAICRLWMLGY